MISRGAAVCALLLLGGCLDAVEVDSAYEREVDLCAAEQASALRTRVERCRARWQDGRRCAGVLSFTGTLQGVPVVVDTELRSTRVEDVDLAGTIVRDSLNMAGSSPYFEFEVAIDQLGGAPDLGDLSRAMTIAPGLVRGSSWYDDDRVQVELNMSAGTRKEIQLVKGVLELTTQRPDEHIGTFSGESPNADSEIHGCFHAFTTDTKLTVGTP